MPERPRTRQTVVFLIVLAGLFFLALFIVPRLPPPQAASAPPAPTSAAPSPAPPDPSCQDAAAPFIAKLDPLVVQWESERQQANQAPLEQLATQIDKLRGLRQQVAGIKPPACAEVPYRSLLGAMDGYIKGYQGFVAELPEDGVRSDLEAAKSEFATYTEEIDRLRKP